VRQTTQAAAGRSTTILRSATLPVGARVGKTDPAGTTGGKREAIAAATRKAVSQSTERELTKRASATSDDLPAAV
jgi:hypothetical protein